MNHSWQDFANAAPDLAAFGEQRFKAAPAYLATVRANGPPRPSGHTDYRRGHLLLFMEPTSPKGHDLQRGSGYALHAAVADSGGGAGEFAVTGHAVLTDDPGLRELARYGYQPKDIYILFELSVESGFSTTYPDGGAPVRQNWKAPVNGSGNLLMGDEVQRGR
ncbi:pyridoxamine 5'-phosphate oxidase [Candidatus Flexifilum breve]|uniref:pyridoxamine 5'-phosphate oxidase n=1 Tax=Candidatus Flexifilum breve TaxID=3140694 RepID=UPI0031CC7292